MSLSDDLKIEQKTAEEQKTTKKAKKKRTRRSKVWSKDDEVIALYLYRSSSSKFIRENYAQKRDISTRAMNMRITVFENLALGKRDPTVQEQTSAIFKEYGKSDVRELENTVIQILRNEFSFAPPKEEEAE